MAWRIRGRSSGTKPSLEIDNEGTHAALQIKQLGNAAASTSSGGAVNLDNSSSTGAGIVAFSSQGSPSGRLIVARYSSATAAQTALYGENAGTGHAIHGNQTASSPNGSGSAGNFTSTNSGASAVQISGVETGRGSLKITHTGTGTDGNASGLSIDLQGAGTAAQGVFVDSASQGTTGALLHLKNNGNEIFRVLTDSTFVQAILQIGAGLCQITSGSGAPAVAAPVGSLYLRTDGGANTTLYVKESGSGTSGWVAK